MSLRDKIRNTIFGKPKVVSTGDSLQLDLPHVTKAIELVQKVFSEPANKYQTYDYLVRYDPELAGAIDTKASFVSKILGGFTVLTGAKRSKREERLQSELNRFHRIVKKYYYDIAFKVIRDGNACYLTHFNSRGLVSLEYLPMFALTCVENERQINGFDQVTKRGVYVLSEGTGKQKIYPASKVIHFDLGKKETDRDLKGRLTIGVWNVSPLESLRAKLLWKSAIILNDMLWRERAIPREHHKLPSAPFDPSNFPGRTFKERYENALKAAQNAIDQYKKKIASSTEEQFLRPDQGYITLDNVEINVVEPKLHHTDPNELLEQIDKSIYSVVTPETTVSGRGRSTFATEAAIMLYTTVKAERVADAIAETLVELAIRHLQNIKGAGWTDEDFEKIVPRFNKILERHTLVRDAAILLESGAFTPTEVRKMMGFEPLSEEDKREIEEWRSFTLSQRKHTESLREIATTGKRAAQPKRPLTPQSESQQQLT